MPLLYTSLSCSWPSFFYISAMVSLLIFKYKMHLPIHKASMQGWIFVQQRQELL